MQPAPAAATGSTTVSPGALRGASVSRRDPEDSCPPQTGWSSASPSNRSSLHSSALALRQLPSTRPAPQKNSPPNVASLQSRGDAAGMLQPPGAREDFDDWDVDLADLDEGQIWRPLPSPAPPAPVSKALRPTPLVRELSPEPSTSSGNKLPPRTPSTPLHSPYPRPVVHSVPPNLCAAPSPVSRPVNRPQGPCPTPGPYPPPRTPAPSTSSTILSPHPLHTPVLTNRLVQLVSASTKPPSKRSRSGGHQPRTRRFPGPAGLLPEQVWPASVRISPGVLTLDSPERRREQTSSSFPH